MALLEAHSSSECFNSFILNSINSSTPCTQHDDSSRLLEATASFFLDNGSTRKPRLDRSVASSNDRPEGGEPGDDRTLAVGRGVHEKKRKRRPRICKNEEEAEAQRMTHIAAERNRRRQMNEHLAALRALMPESHAQRGDQASVVGGAIEFVKELERHVQSLEAQKLQQHTHTQRERPVTEEEEEEEGGAPKLLLQPHFPQPLGLRSKYASRTTEASADIEVTLIESHASVRILERRGPRKLSKMVAGFRMLRLSILHLSVATLAQLVTYAISAKVEEGCQLGSVDDIAESVHHMLRIVEDEGAPC